ncbi:Hypothetical predicted protein [Pelobates cultripes]|uniref:Uncharacterized protein n=1 Tax=Pelobates cultripes TaxID=61616 RepID=A0AAD1WAI4_PELCU|nr:Hypothetical predicted protein [Pelobates cultripes]
MTAKAQNSLVTHSETLAQQIDNLEMQVEDLSNKSRRNTLCICGLPETPYEGPLAEKMVDYFKHLITDIPEEKWVIDRAHRALRARRVDIIIRSQHYSTKEAIVHYSQDNTLQYQDAVLHIYQDLSPATMQYREE